MEQGCGRVRQDLEKLGQRPGRHRGGKREGIPVRHQEDATRGPERGHALDEAGREFGREGAFDLNGRDFAGGSLQNKIDLGTGVGAVVAATDGGREQGKGLFQAIAFPGVATKWVTKDLLDAMQSGKGVEEAGVAPIDLGGLHEALAGVATPG